MAKLSFGLTSAIGNVTRDGPTLTDAQMLRFFDYIWDAYPQYDTDPETGIQTRKTRNNANLAASYRAWADALWNGTKANVFAYEAEKAAAAARAAVTQIDA